MAGIPDNAVTPAAGVAWTTSPEHPDADAVSDATRLDFDQVSGRAAMRSPVFLASVDGLAISTALIFDSLLGYLLAVDLMGPRVGRFNRLVDPLETSRPALWRRRERATGAEAETILCGVAPSLLLRHRDVGLTLQLRGAHDDIDFGLPAHFLRGFLTRVEGAIPAGKGVGTGKIRTPLER